MRQKDLDEIFGRIDNDLKKKFDRFDIKMKDFDYKLNEKIPRTDIQEKIDKINKMRGIKKSSHVRSFVTFIILLSAFICFSISIIIGIVVDNNTQPVVNEIHQSVPINKERGNDGFQKL